MPKTKPTEMRVLQSDLLAATVELTRDELVVLNNALNEVRHGPEAIEEWEFSTRMGVERGEAERLLSELASLLAG